MKIILLLINVIYEIKEILFQHTFEASLGISWWAVPFVFLMSVIAIPFILSIQVHNPWSNKIWERPRWNSNFLNFRNPIDFLSLGGYYFIITGGIRIVGNFIKFQQLSMDGLLMLASGAGILLGVYLSYKYIFKEKFAKTK